MSWLAKSELRERKKSGVRTVSADGADKNSLIREYPRVDIGS
jgi:hypothetical protein